MENCKEKENSKAYTYTGIVTGSVGGLYTVDLSNGDTIECKARGRFRHERLRLLPGDRVIVEYPDSSSAVVEDILERKNSLIRPPLANVDILLCVAAITMPEIDILTYDKLIISAEKNKIEPVIVITKSDIDSESANEFANRYIKCGFKAFCVSSISGEGLSELGDYLTQHKDKLIVASGASGVGKSSLMNALLPDMSLQVGQLSNKIMRGKQTTRQCNLYPLSKLLRLDSAHGYLADTPGFSMIDFVNFDFCTKEELPELFREFDRYIGKCRYTKCRHLKEEGCSVIQAVTSGEIPKSRHDSFLSMYEELKNKNPWDKK